MTSAMEMLMAFAVGVLLGAGAVAWLLLAREKAARSARDAAEDAFKALSAEALAQNNRAFMELAKTGAELDAHKLSWMIGLHMTFLASGVLFALMDWIASKTEDKHHKPHGPVAP